MSLGLDLHPDGLPPPESQQHWILQWLHRVEDATLVLFVASLVGLQLLQIILRNVEGGGFDWAEPATQMLVLWIAWLGAARASREGQHVAVDIIAHYARGRFKQFVGIAALLFSTTACLIAAWFCASFVIMERCACEIEEGAAWYSVVFLVAKPFQGEIGLLRQPLWIYQIIIPLALTLIGVRFLLQAARIGFKKDAAR
jgi:TRAP-type C4-dicarboxylate transport system permease small subunit